jgi:hypothetical protein
MDCSTKALGSYVDMDDNTLRLVSKSCVSISQTESHHLDKISMEFRLSNTMSPYLIRTRDYTWELSILLVLSLDDCFDDAGMV